MKRTLRNLKITSKGSAQDLKFLMRERSGSTRSQFYN